jgi:hypothetical protein
MLAMPQPHLTVDVGTLTPSESAEAIASVMTA